MGDELQLGIAGFEYADLHDPAALARLDDAFLAELHAVAPTLHASLLDYRRRDTAPPPVELSRLLLELAPHLETFLGRLFGIEGALAAARGATQAHNPVLAFKKYFVLRRARRYPSWIATAT